LDFGYLVGVTSDRIKRLGVLGGTFDPLHHGHLSAATAALEAFDLDRVLFVPAGRPWQKSKYTDHEDRYLMTVLGAAEHPCFAVSRLELDRSGPTYTADTMEQLRSWYGADVDLYFILGADALQGLGTWEGVERLIGLTEIIAVARPGVEFVERTPGATWPVVHLLEVPGVDISATDVRKRVKSGLPVDELLPKGVLRYVQEHGLYLKEKEAQGAGSPPGQGR
jgi:nicotinate-nucleotide adenylyltransferase